MQILIHMSSRRRALATCALFLSSAASATTTVHLPDWVCAHPDALYVDGFQPAAAVVRLPSNGSGGAIGNVTRSVTVAGFGTQNVYVHVPPSYSATQPMPLVFALHGQAGSPAAAQTSAQSVRTAWTSIADANGFIVIAPVGSDSTGSWDVPPPGPSDYDMFAAAIADAEANWNIDRSRRTGWGFSAGAHVMHDLVLNHYTTLVTIDTFSGYAVSAGATSQFACASTSGCNAIIAAASRKIPLDIHVGTTDPLLPAASNDHTWFQANGWVNATNLWFTTFTGGHTYASAQLAQIWTNLCPFQALP